MNPAALQEPAGFGGQYGYYTDRETGLLCLTHRYYDPGTGRFINRDPIGYDGGVNLYGFAGGNPVNFADPSGLNPNPLATANHWLETKNSQFVHWVGRQLLHALTAGTVIDHSKQPTFKDAYSDGTAEGDARANALKNGGKAANNFIEGTVGTLAVTAGLATFSRSNHAEERANQGRPVGLAAQDTLQARVADVFIQELDGNVVVRGANGREHIWNPLWEPNIKQLTSLTRTKDAHLGRLRKGDIRPASEMEVEQLKAKFTDTPE